MRSDNDVESDLILSESTTQMCNAVWIRENKNPRKQIWGSYQA